jgi:hypothetical protein
MALLILAATGPRGEELALAAGKALDIPVGWDAEFDSATFDSDGHAEDELQAAVFEQLDSLDLDWRSHLELAE